MLSRRSALAPPFFSSPFAIAVSIVLAIGLAACGGDGDDSVPSEDPAPTFSAMPSYDPSGALVRPEHPEEWVFVGSALNLNYDGTPTGVDILSNVLMEPSAYRHYQETGEFREGTMTALFVYLAGTDTPPARDGLFTDLLVGFEMSMKNSHRFPKENWAYYRFGRPDAPTAEALPPETCHSCHEENAATDHVFTQFYPALR